MASISLETDTGRPAHPPMILTATSVEEFRALLRECGVALDVDESWRRARELIALYRMLMSPIPEDPGVQTSGDLLTSAVDESVVVP